MFDDENFDIESFDGGGGEAAVIAGSIGSTIGGWSWETVEAYSESDKRRRKRLRKAEERLDAILAEVIDGPQDALPEPIVAAARPVQKAEAVLDQIQSLDPGVLRDIQRLLSEIGRIERSIEKARREQEQDEDDAAFLLMVA